MSMDRVLEPSAEVAGWGEFRPRPLALRAVSSVFWTLADAGWATCAAVSNARRGLGPFMTHLPERLGDGAVAGAVGLFRHRWKIAGALGATAAAVAAFHFVPEKERPHVVAAE